MSREEDSGEKAHEATQRRLDEARKRGEIPRSADLSTAAAYAGMLVAIAVIGAGAIGASGLAAQAILSGADRLSTQIFSGGTASIVQIVTAMVTPLWPFALGPTLAVAALLTVTRAWIFVPGNLAPRVTRISVVAAAGRRFGPSGLLDFSKSLIKLVLVSLILGYFLAARLPDLLTLVALSPSQASAGLLGLTIDFLFLVLVLALVMGIADQLLQVSRHRRRNRMTRTELTDEAKDSEGDPHQKAARRQRAEEIATNRMLADVAKADVVIVNPSHFAVALKWARGDRRAPVCLAKGVDEIAARIRERAGQNGIPIHSDPPTARALHATMAIGDEVRPEHYSAVAAAIRFSENMRRKAGRNRQGAGR